MSNNSIQLELKELTFADFNVFDMLCGEFKCEFGCKIDQLLGHEVKSSQKKLLLEKLLN